MKSNNSTPEKNGKAVLPPNGYFDVNYDSCLISLSILIIAINLLVLVLFVKRRPLRTKTNLLLVSLSVSDLMMGLLGIPMNTACNALVGYKSFSGLCITSAAVYRFIAVSTIFHILIITGERYVSVIYPFRYMLIVTKRRIVLLITSVWFFSLFMALIQLAWQEFDHFTSRNPTKLRWGLIYNIVGIVVCLLVPLVLMLFFYARMFKVIRHQAKQIRKLNNIQESRGSGKHLVAEKRAITIFALMLGIFTCCWSTWYIGLLQDYLSRDVFYAIPSVWLLVFDFLRFSTSFINPMLYTFLKQDFRRELHLMIPSRCLKKYERGDQLTMESMV
ncbi:hypothetical protein ACROYT_G033366 [Oculina patagonica]